MSTYDELLGTVKVVRDRTGDPNAWQAGLTPAELTAVITPTTRSDDLAPIVAKIRRQHPDLFGAPAAPPGADLPGREEGAAVEAISGAEAALSHQNSASSQLDLQVVSAIMNAHLKTVEGRDALTTLQRDTEAAVRVRSDLDTPAGARDFQRFLIGKLRDIRAVVLNASLDDTSKSALMAAWTSLYDASKDASKDTSKSAPDEPRRLAATANAEPAGTAASAPVADAGTDPLLDSLLADDPGLLGEGTGGGTAPAAGPTVPNLPNAGVAPLPGAGTMTGWSPPGGLPLPGRLEGADPAPAGPDDQGPPPAEGAGATDDSAAAEDVGHDEERDEDASADSDRPPSGPTTVTLPDGETVTAASPELAAAIKAAAGGAPIADAFSQQGITIPAPGTAVRNPIDPVQVIPGDIGIFTDRHALALGHGKALLDGQIQHIATVSGPSFLGWEHPPAATSATAPAGTDTPAPTRPAATSA
ncbi:DUF4226 domain-containing protein [Mycobacterium shigaense]|uniref:Uncharacterized protein n=1 Tax=Mycobacterium shigaense TaxID=722731 RepID=A0A1Z4EB83_9MYCO|nr:DUF4226 domain-containing protein [Mycobacterium shigaense]MEA1121460.1 DUF4226 domain-containing protein [Mycobacterium shigaense]PRI15249.1 hypothetical protein B2J96_12635 [Mycobacterium shigaense]BAX90206.1 hypothetical protein MSG_00039 [Mycobacterium shigaense]